MNQFEECTSFTEFAEMYQIYNCSQLSDVESVYNDVPYDDGVHALRRNADLLVRSFDDFGRDDGGRVCEEIGSLDSLEDLDAEFLTSTVESFMQDLILNVYV